MKNIILILILTLTLGLSACQKKSEPTANQKPIVKIGVILPLSGNMGYWGELLRDGILMAKEDLKLGDKTKFNYELIFEDDQLDGKLTASAAQKLIHVDKVDVVISATSGSGNIVSPITEENKVIHFGIAADPEIAKGKYNFIHWTPPREQARVLVKVLKEKRLSRVAVFIFNQQGAKALFTAVKEVVEKTDIQIVSLATVNLGERDFRMLINKAKQSKPDVYLLCLFSPELEIFARQFQEQNITQPLTSIDSFGYTSSPELFEKKWFIAPLDMPEDAQERFLKKYGHKSISTVGNAYDCIQMIVYAYENMPSMKKPSTDEIVDALHKIKDFDGMLGKLSIDADGIVQSISTLKEIRNGKPVITQRDF